MDRKTIMVAFGGESSEHDVSIRSARNVYMALDKQKYNVILGYIDKNGHWWLLESWHDQPDEHRNTQLAVMPGAKTFLTVPGRDTIPVDVIFPVLHGKLGEDGTIQGLANMAHIPMVGCGVETSALCMNKDACKQLLAAEGIPVVPWITVRPDDDVELVKRRTKDLSQGGPWFVKPSRAGSSVGVSRVTDLNGLETALALAFEHDDTVLIETAIIGRELEVAVLGNVPNHKTSDVGEIFPGSDFYDYDDKYSPQSSSRTELDARLPETLTKMIQQYAYEAYELLGCSGLARVDFLLSDDLVPYLGEINTMPGFTDISMYPKLWEAKGVPQSELVDRLIELALE